MQPRANQAQQRFIGLDLLDFKWRSQAIFSQLVPGFAQAGGSRHPQNNLQVTQATGGFFAVGFQRVGRVFKLVVALAQL